MTEWHPRDTHPITEEMLVRAVHILADIVEQKGAAFRPLYQDLRQQLADFRLQAQASAAVSAGAEASSRVA